MVEKPITRIYNDFINRIQTELNSPIEINEQNISNLTNNIIREAGRTTSQIQILRYSQPYQPPNQQ